MEKLVSVIAVLGFSLGVVSAAVADSTPLMPESTAVAPSKASFGGPSAGAGIDQVGGEKLAEAIGHYARSRSLLIAAINEFDKAYKLANPDLLLDSHSWRNSVEDRAQELEKVLDPQPRISRGGVKFDADTRLLNEAN